MISGFCNAPGRNESSNRKLYSLLISVYSTLLILNGLLSENCRDSGTYGGSSEQAIALQIQRDALEQMLEIENTITASFADLDSVVEPFNKTAVFTIDQIVCNFLPPSSKHFQERHKM